MTSWGSFAFDTLKSIIPLSPTEEPVEPETHTFTHEVVFDLPNVKKDDYWEHVMEPGFDFFIYDSHGREAKPTERSYLVKGDVVHRETEVEVDQDSGLGVITSFFDTKRQGPITYLSIQRKFHDGTFTIAYENTFNNSWEEYIKKMNGVVILRNEPNEENPHRFVQRFTVEVQVSIGWNTGSWISKSIGSFTDSLVLSTIRQKFIEKVDQLPFYFSSFRDREEFQKTLKEEYAHSSQ